MMINGVNLNSESLHKNLLLSAQKMTDTKSTLPQKNTFANFTSMGGSREINQAPNMTLNDLKNGMHTTHVRLQNNGWNYENFCRLYKNNVTHTNNNNNNNLKSNNNNNNNNQNNFNNKNLIKMVEMKEQSSKRTQDQENAFRCIEDVHNYAKVKSEDSEFHSGDSSRSSRLDDDEDDDDDEEEATEDSTETVDLEQKHKSLRTDNTLMSHLKYIKKYRLIKREPEEDMHIDVETVPQEEELQNQMNLESVKKDCKTTTPEPDIAPDHHARRPMNAFLIFCKRHRAIVKDRYKTLENRAITKILGDWWASLDADDKECFTNLAQQNKDAFFSANPNFKWYKLPAPPLRSLRANSSEIMNEYPSSSTEFLSGDDSQNNYFKLADETQMGDLSALLTHSEKRKQKHIKNDHAALQQALGETTLFFNKHMQSVKRSYVDSNNLAEMDEFLPKKTSRSCKGKKYQELMQSGQIAASAKKSKVTLPKQQLQHQQQQQLQFQQAYEKQQQQHQHQQEQDDVKSKQMDDQQVVEKQEQQLVDSKVFDLEEKIKELPALSLDLYLQRKRNVKKKRKINAKKSNNSSHSNATTTTTTTSVTAVESESKNNKNKNKNNLIEEAQECKITVRAVVVGSQKRKARKESITRRDVSSVENEVTAVLPMSSTVHYNNIRGNFYFDDTVTSTTYANGLSARSENVAKSIMFNNETFNNCNKAIPPTSDLLILAEVAEKTSCY